VYIVGGVTDATQGTPKRRYAPRLPVEKRREHLLDAALRVLARDGYERLTVEAIAREADVTRPVVYSAYDGLEPLLHALLDRTQRRALASAIRLLPHDGLSNVDGWLVDMLGSLLDVVQEEPEVWRPVLGLTRNAPDVVRERIESTKDLLRGYITDAIQAGLERRGGPDLDADILARMVMVVGEEFARLVLDDPERFPRSRLMETFEGLLASRFLVDEASPGD
jgi:AcrR family transcriptional regulator